MILFPVEHGKCPIFINETWEDRIMKINKIVLTGVLLCVAIGCKTKSVSKKLPVLMVSEVMKRGARACQGNDINNMPSDSVKEVDKLLKEGYSVELEVTDYGATLLHLATLYEDDRLVRFLLQKGASRTHGDKYGRRPIDYAYANSNTNMCRILALESNSAELIIAGLPEYIWNIIFQFRKKNMSPIRSILIVNEMIPSEELIKWNTFKELGFIADTFVETKNGSTGFLEWRRKGTTERVSICCVNFKKVTDVKYTCSILFRDSPQPLSFGFYTEYEAHKEYGYWFVKRKESLEM